MDQQTNSTIKAPRAHDRFKDAPWYGPQSITVIGQGGIGSWLTLLLARAGHEIYTYDFDHIEVHNLGGQLFSYDQIGMLKTEAVRDTVFKLTENTAISTSGKFDENSFVSPIMMVGPDKMEPRKLAFEKWIEEYKDLDRLSGPIFIDGRLEAETMQIWAVTPNRAAEYFEKAIFPDSDVPDAPCTFRASSHSAVIIAGLMVTALNNHRANIQDGDYREVPLLTTLELPTFSFDTVS